MDLAHLRLSVCLIVVLCISSASADPISDIISQATLEEYQGHLRILTGVDPVPGDPPYYLANRYSFGTDILVAGEWILNQFTSYGLSAGYHTFNPAYGPNVIAELPGTTRPEDVYIICAHYDTYNGANQYDAPGCDDNASGTAAVLEAARVLSQYQFEATIRFIAFSGEEQWMVGSLAYAEYCALYGQPISAAVNWDMILHPGFDNQEPDPDYDLDIESNAASQGLANYFAAQVGAYTPLDVQVHIGDNLVSDHWSFWQYGYQAVGLVENTVFEIWGGSNDTYHTVDDTMDNPDWDWDFAVHTLRGGMAGVIGLAGLVPEPSTGMALTLLALMMVHSRRK